MKVLLVTEYWKESDGGGFKTYLVNLEEGLKDQGVDTKVAFNEGKDQANFKVEGSRFFFPLRTAAQLRRERFTVIHSHGAWYCLLAGLMCAYGTKAKNVHTFHSEPTPGLFSKLFVQLLINRCDAISFPSRGLMETFSEIYDLRGIPLSVAYGGVTYAEPSTDDVDGFVKKYGLEGKKIILLLGFTALRIKADGAKMAMLAFKQLDNKDAVLLLTRDGVFSKELKDFAEEQIIDNVLFVGDVENPLEALKASDILFFPYLSRGPGIAVYEAMAAQTPIIVTRCSGEEIVHDGVNGLLCEPSPADMALKLRMLLDDESLAEKLGEGGRKTYEEKLTIESSSSRVLELYRTL